MYKVITALAATVTVLSRPMQLSFRSVNGNWANRGSRFSGKEKQLFILIPIELPFNCEPEIHFTLQLCSNFKIERWDAAYFLKIAEQGYKYEQYMAFFPFYPLLLRILARTLQLELQYFASERSLLLACGWVLNSVFFAFAAVSLYRLTLFGKKNVALVSSLLFCFNPASVFMSILYTESLFCCLQFTALCYLDANPFLIFFFIGTKR